MKGKGILITSMLIIVVAVAAFVTSSFDNTSFAIEPDSAQMSMSDTIISNTAGADAEDGVHYFVHKYALGSDRAFCVDYTKNAENGTYTKKDEATDNGLRYLLTVAIDVEGNYSNDDVESISTFVRQSAIWVYQYRQKPTANTSSSGVNVRNGICDDEQCSSLKPITELYVHDQDDDDWQNYHKIEYKIDNDEDGFESMILSLVNKAESYQNSGYDVSSFKLSNLKSEQKEDNEYYIYGPISVTGSDGKAAIINSYTVKITSNIDGAELIDSDGKAITEETALSSIASFYIKVPIKSLSEDKKVISLFANGVSNGVLIYKGAKDTVQDIGVVKPVNRDASLNVPFKVTVDVPNTGMTAAQIVYFIGLIVLLCGVGIVYANVKPKEAE